MSASSVETTPETPSAHTLTKRSAWSNPYLLLILTTLFWSGNMVVGRALRGEVPPIALAFWRWVIAFLLTLPLALPYLRPQLPILRKHWKMLLLLGLLGVGFYNTFAYLALQYTAATNAILLNSFVPIVIIGISWAFLGKPLSGRETLGVGISLLGALTIVARGDIATLLGLSLNIGDLWMLAAVLTWAIYTVALQWRPAGLHPMLTLSAFTLVGVVFLAPFYAWEVAAGKQIHLSLGNLLGVAYTGIFPGFLAYVFWNRAVAEVGGNKAGLFIHLMPVFGTVLSALFLAEYPHSYHYLGIAAIFSGIWLTTTHKKVS